MPGSFEGTKAFSVDGVTLAYREQGVGEPVVLVHGASDLRIWEHQEAAVADAFRSIAYSRRYARPNADIEPGIDDQILPHVEDLATLLNALRAAPAHLVGHSLGARCAADRGPPSEPSPQLSSRGTSGHLAFCQHAAEADRDFAASGHTALPSCIHCQVWHHGDRSGPAAFRRGDDEAAVQAFSAGVLGRDAFANMSTARRQQVRENEKVIRAQLLGAGFPALTDKEVRSVDLPVMLVVGANSPPLFHQLSRRLQELLPRSELVTIANASHVVQDDNPTAFNEALLTFLGNRRGT